MKKIIQILFWILLLSSPLFAASYYGGGGVSTDSNCDQAKYYSIGRLCQDTDDGKLYKGTGAAVVEIAAGNSGDFLANGTVPMTGSLDAALGIYTKNGETSAGFIDFFEDGSNGSNYARLYGPASLAGNISWILPNTALARGSFLIGSSTANTFDWLTVGASGKVITTDGTDPSWSAYTVAAPGSAGAVLYSDGTNWTRSATPSLQALTLTGANALALGTSRTNDGKLILSSGTALNDYLFTIQASNFGANLTWTLPTAAPGGANYLLNVDADGTMGYTDPSTLGNVAADTIWDAKGDLAVGTGANTAAKLAAGTAYQILHVATDTPGWTSTLGATGTRLTKGWFTNLEITNPPTINGAALTTILQPLDTELTAIAGLTSAANAIPYFTGSGTAGVISSSANMVSLLESEDYGTALSNLGGQAYNADLDTISAGGTAGCLWGEKSDGSGIECKTKLNLQLDDTAAQFNDATDATKTMLLELGSITTETKRTLTVPDADGTIALVKAEKLAVFNIPGTSADNTVVDAYIPVASTITGVVITTTGAACSAVVDIWSQAYADFPPENAQTITASAPPTLTTAQMSKDETLAGWTTAVAADTVLRANLDSSDCAGNIQVTIYGKQ